MYVEHTDIPLDRGLSGKKKQQIAALQGQVAALLAKPDAAPQQSVSQNVVVQASSPGATTGPATAASTPISGGVNPSQPDYTGKLLDILAAREKSVAPPAGALMPFSFPMGTPAPSQPTTVSFSSPMPYQGYDQTQATPAANDKMNTWVIPVAVAAVTALVAAIIPIWVSKRRKK